MVLILLRYVLLLVEVVSCVLLIGIILMQKSKSQGAGLAFGGGMGESLFGAQMGNVLTKATVVIAVIFLLNTTALSLIQARRRPTSAVDIVKDVAAAPMVPMQQQTAPMAPPTAPGPMAPIDIGDAEWPEPSALEPIQESELPPALPAAELPTDSKLDVPQTGDEVPVELAPKPDTAASE